MSGYIPQYDEQDLAAMPNCLCGESGKSRNERECLHRKSCAGCGFDKTEHQRRVNLIRRAGLQEISFGYQTDLMQKYGVGGERKLRGLIVRKKK